jgi:hypothetical protein
MSSLDGYKPEDSMLTGGESVPIQPSQAGGGNPPDSQYKPEDSMLTGGESVPIQPSQAGGDPVDNDFTEEEQNEIKQASATAYAILLKENPQANEKDITEASINAANTHALKILKLKTENSEEDILSDATESEKKAAEKAIEISVLNPDFLNKYPDPEQRKKALHEIAIKAVLLERKRSNIKIVKAREERAKSNVMTSYLADDIKGIENTTVYTEFYQVNPPEDESKISNLRNIVTTKFIEINDEVAFKRIKTTMYLDVDKYKYQRTKQWNAVYQATDKKVSAILPVIQINNIAGNEVFTQFSRFIYCLPYNLERIIVIPAIRGSTDTFVNVLHRLQKIGALTYKKLGGKDTYKIRRGVVIVFMPSFYAKVENTTENMVLFSIFIDINRTNPNQIFILSESTADNYAVGVFLAKSFSQSDVFKISPLTMLEPSYIAYPYTRTGLNGGFIVSASTDAEKVNMPASIGRYNFGLKDLHSHKSYGSALGLAVKPSTTGVELFIEGAEGVFTIRSTKNAHTLLNLERAVGYPPGPCDGLLQSASLDKFLKPQFFADRVQINGVKSNALIVIQLNSRGDHNPLCTSALTEAPSPLHKDDRHKSSDNVVQSEDKVHIDIKGNTYTIRVPSIDNKVDENWLKGEYTKDEAEFLNSTNLRPGVLHEVFGESWQSDLEKFLTTLVVSECMSDVSLLTNRECYNCRQFLEKVNVYFINNSLQLDLIKEEDDRRADTEFRKYADELYGDEEDEPKVLPSIGIASIDARNATAEELISRKQVFGDISSYKHKGNAENPQNERRAIIIGVNKKTGMYNFYVVSTLSNHTDADKDKEDDELVKKVKNDLPIKYKDYVFIY